MSKKTPSQIIQNAIDIQEQCIPVQPGLPRNYMIGMLNGLKYGKYAINGGNIDFSKTNVRSKIRHKSIKRIK
jgi:hypothetical protein